MRSKIPYFVAILIIILMIFGSYKIVEANQTALQSQTNWHVWYYSNPQACDNPSCQPTQVYCERDFQGGIFHINYPSDGRACETGNDQWGSIWKSTITFDEGDYVFYADHDDGIKIFVGDRNIMDVGTNELGNKTCPSVHLSGDTPVTVIHNNTGGEARINVWWNTDTSVCNQDPIDSTYSIKTGADGVSWATFVNTNTRPVVHYWSNGQEVVTSDYWQTSGNDIFMIIPNQAESFLVEGSTPQIWSCSQTVWKVNGQWALHKSVNVQGYLVTYIKGEALPTTFTYANGLVETITNHWKTNNGTDYYFYVPKNAISFEIGGGARPELLDWPGYLFINETGTRKVLQRSIFVTVDESTNMTKIVYQNNIVPSLATVHAWFRGGTAEQDLTNWWSVKDGLLFMTLPNEVVSVIVDNGPMPIILDNASTFWSLSSDQRWLVRKAVNPTPTLTATPTVVTDTPTYTPTSTEVPPTPTPTPTVVPTEDLPFSLFCPFIRK